MPNNDSNDECFEEKDLTAAGARKRKAYQNVGDPVKVNSRGAGRGKKQKCGLCSVEGHKKGSCPQNPMNKNKQTTRGRGRQNAQGRGRQNYHSSPLREQHVESNAYGYNPDDPSWFQEFYDNIF